MDISGNHEYYTADVINWMNYLEELGFVVLHNSHVNISDNSGGSFCLAGCDDIAANLLLSVELLFIVFFVQYSLSFFENIICSPSHALSA